MDLLTAYSNRPELLDELVTAQCRLKVCAGKHEHERRSVCSEGGIPSRPWRATDRLTTEEIEDLIARYRAGTTARELAERYGLSRSTVKRLLRERGIRRQPSQSQAT